MPIMKTPYKYGNLFIHFEVEFPEPGSLQVRAVRKFASGLPGDTVMIYAQEALNAIPYDKSQITENETIINSDYKEDDEQDLRLAGGHGVQ